MTREEQVREVLHGFLHAGLIECDAQKVLSFISGDVMGYGMGEQGFVCSWEDISRVIEHGVKKEPGVHYELCCEREHIRFPADSVATVCATVTVRRIAQGKAAGSGLMQSLTLRLEPEGWKICALHASPVILSEESIDAYPLTYAENTLAQLRSELQQETFDLMNKSLSGGILSCRREGDRLPLYFVNDNMLDYLNYTREEFMDRYGADLLRVIHPGDQEMINGRIQTAIRGGGDFEAQVRMLKKGGEECWMLVRGRYSNDEDGSEILIGVFVDVTEMVALQNRLEAQARELAISEERFRIALEKTSNVIFDYDIISGNILHSSVPKQSMEFVTNIQDARDNLVIGGRIEEEFLEDFSKAFESIQNDARQASCVVRVRLVTDKRVWNRISLTGITDQTGRTVRAIGMIEDITRQKEAEIAFAQEEQYRHAILADAMASYVVNFTRGIFEDCRVNSPYCLDVARGAPYEASIQEGLRSRFSEEGRLAYLDTFSRTRVLQAYEEGSTEFVLEYRIINPDGTDMWMRTTMHLIEDSLTGELKGFMYVTDIDRRKREELELLRKSEQDPMTEVYNKGAAVARIEEALRSYDGIQTGVFLMLDVDRFKLVNDRYGHPCGDRVLIAVAGILREHFRENDIVGRLGGDEFCVFFCGINSVRRLEEAAASICERVRQIPCGREDGFGLSCSIGIAACAGTAKSFAQIYREADRALYRAKESGRDCFAFYDGE